MREIKFRGKTKKGTWIYGSLGRNKNCFRGKLIDTKNIIFNDVECFNSDNFSYIVNDHSVLEDTIGQFIGLKDKNGKEIYEGDIVVYDSILYDNMVCICEFDESTSSFMLVEKSLPFGDSHYIHRSETGNMEVIGNIYDNANLLKKSK